MRSSTVIMEEDLDTLVILGDIKSYVKTEEYSTGNPSYETLTIELPSGLFILVHSGSTPAPESSYLGVEVARS